MLELDIPVRCSGGLPGVAAVKPSVLGVRLGDAPTSAHAAAAFALVTPAQRLI